MTEPIDPTALLILLLILLPLAVCLLAVQILASPLPPRELGGCSQNCAQGRRCSCKEKK